MENNIIVPSHVGFIMDGNGRWALNKGKNRNYGHVAGANNVERVVEYCFEKGIKVITLYTFSCENWQRPESEVNKILSLLEKFLNKYTKTLLKNEVRLVFSGDLNALPDKLKNLCLLKKEQTACFTEKTLNLAINYGGRQEILKACNNLINSETKIVTEDIFRKYLYTADLPDIDLVIRTSGEKRLSNFFIFQCAYSEFYFTDVLWPDFNETEIDKALEWFSHRQRRFGKV